MAIARRAVGTEAHASSGTIAPGKPTGTAVDDILVAVSLSGSTGALGFPTGWTKKFEVDLGTTSRLTMAWKRADGSEASTISITGATQDVQAVVTAYSGCTTSGDPFDAASTSNSPNTAGTTLTHTAVTPSNADSMLLLAGGQHDTGSATSTFSGYSGSNPTPSEAFDVNFQGSTINTSIFMADGTKNDTTSTGSRTTTATSSLVWATITALLIPAGAGGGTTNSGAASSTGAGTATATGASSASSNASSTGASTAIATGAAAASGVASSTGASTAIMAGTMVLPAAASSIGQSTAQAVGASAASGDASSTGLATAQATGQSVASGDMNGIGVSTAIAEGQATGSGAGDAYAAGTSTAIAVGASTGGDITVTTTTPQTLEGGGVRNPWGERKKKRDKELEQEDKELMQAALLAVERITADYMQR